MSQLGTSLLLGAQKLCDMIECHKRVTSVTRRSVAMVWAKRGIQVRARAKMRGFSAALQTTCYTWHNVSDKRNVGQLWRLCEICN